MSEVLPAFLAEYHHGRQEYDFQFQEQVPVFDIVKVIHELVTRIIHARSVRIHYLRVAGDTGIDIVAEVVIRNDFVKGLRKNGAFRTWARDGTR